MSLKLDQEINLLHEFEAQIAKAVVGNARLSRRMLVCLLSGGHILIEGLPGLAKTLSVRTMATLLDFSFVRIQFTPDLLPTDLTGGEVFYAQKGSFTFESGPLFNQLVLADEINRAPAKVQSALLEAMGEGQISVGKKTYKMHEPFMVIATMNPIEQEGTYQLPEAQLDRFLLKTEVSYPSYADELRIVEGVYQLRDDFHNLRPVLGAKEILKFRQAVEQVRCDQGIVEYCVRLVRATRGEHEDSRFSQWIQYGAGPRAVLALAKCARALALIQGRDEVEPDDIAEIAPDILRHRLLLSFEAETEGVSVDDVIGLLLQQVRFY